MYETLDDPEERDDVATSMAVGQPQRDQGQQEEIVEGSGKGEEEDDLKIRRSRLRSR